MCNVMNILYSMFELLSILKIRVLYHFIEVITLDYIDKLIALRIDNDLSQNAVGKVINKSQQGYDHIEKRRAKLAIEDLKKLCEFYKVSADELLELNITK